MAANETSRKKILMNKSDARGVHIMLNVRVNDIDNLLCELSTMLSITVAGVLRNPYDTPINCESELSTMDMETLKT